MRSPFSAVLVGLIYLDADRQIESVKFEDGNRNASASVIFSGVTSPPRINLAFGLAHIPHLGWIIPTEDLTVERPVAISYTAVS